MPKILESDKSSISNIEPNKSEYRQVHQRGRPIKNGVFVLSLAALTLLPGCAEAKEPVVQEQSYQALSAELTQADIYSAAKRAADWQLTRYNSDTNLFEGYDEGAFMAPHDSDSHPQGWVYAALHVGMAKWAKLADSKGDDSYYKWLRDVAKKNKYLFSPRIYNADDYAIGQLYIDLYERYKDPEMLVPLKVIFDIILNTPSTVDLRFELIDQPSIVRDGSVVDHFGGRTFPLAPCKNRWCWADALFMGPPVWIHLAEITGDQRYMEFADKELWETVELLWDEDDHLFFRDSRFFDVREPNGEKVIWARGVGWVAAGLARILEHLPEDHKNRAKYEDIFYKMMKRLAGAQQADGLWRPSVLAPETKPFKETSGTALMAFAYASGVNQGVLDRDEFMPIIEKAWVALIDATQSNGKLGWVQQIGHKPNDVSEEDTQLYAIGAFLAFSSELHQLVGTNNE